MNFGLMNKQFMEKTVFVIFSDEIKKKKTLKSVIKNNVFLPAASQIVEFHQPGPGLLPTFLLNKTFFPFLIFFKDHFF